MLKNITFLIALLMISATASADRTINSATVDGAATTTISPAVSINLSLSVTTTGNGASNDWESTGWRIASSPGALTCEDHADFTSAGTSTIGFGINAPLVDGSYNVYLEAYQNDTCTGGASATFVLNNAVTVDSGGLSCSTFRDEFSNESYANQDGTANWSTNWIETGDNGNASNGDIEISGGQLQLEGDGSGGGRAAFGGEPSIEREADLSSFTSATLSFNYSESGSWEGNDDIEIWISADGGSNWTLLDTFSNDQSPGSYSRDISAYIASNTRIAFVEKANAGDEIFFFDDVQIEGCGGSGGGSGCGAIGVNFAGFGGASIRLEDSENNGSNMSNGTYAGNAGLNVGATTPTNGNTVTLPDLDPETLPTNSSTVDDNLSNGETINATTEVFYDDITLTNERSASLTGGGPFHIDNLTVNDESTLNLAAGTYYIDELSISDEGRINVTSEPVIIYIGTDFDMDDDARISNASVTGFRVYMLIGSNEARIRDGSEFTGMIYAPYGADIRIEDAEVNGQLITTGELEIEDSQLTLSPSDASAASSVTTCPEVPPITPLAEWRFDEGSWSGSVNEVVDTQGSANGTAVNGANTAGSSPALVGDPGTCNYGVFDGDDDYIDLAGMSNLTGSFSITAWIYADSTVSGSRIFIDDQNNNNGFGFSLGDPGNGKLRFFSRNVNPVSVDTQNVVINPGQWYHVAAVHNASAKTRQIFINGAAVALNTGGAVSTYTGTWGSDNGAASIGGENNNSTEASPSYRFDGNIDEVRVYNGALTAAEIATVMAETHVCAVSVVDHFVINVGAGAASTCAAFPFSVTAEDSSNNPVLDYTGTVTLTAKRVPLTTPVVSNGNFEVVTATNPITPDPDIDDNGSASYTFDTLDDGLISMALANEHAETLTITVEDSSIPVTTTSADITFSDNSFIITDTDGNIAGDNIVVAGRGHSYQIQMVRKDNACGPATGYSGAKSLKLWRSKNTDDPSTNQPQLANTLPVVGNTLPDADPGAANGSITFSNGIANVSLATTDIGKFRIELADISNTFSDQTIAGTSFEQIVRPFGIGIDFSNLRDADVANGGLNGSDLDTSYATAAQGLSGTIFAQAGVGFSVTVEGVLHQSGDDNNDDGIPDDDSNGDGILDDPAYLGDNTAAPSFGQEAGAEKASVTLTVSSAAPGSDGNITGDFFNSFTLGSQTSTMTYDNAGIMALTAISSDYFSSGVDLIGVAPEVGRFIPVRYAVESSAINSACAIVLPGFTYARQPFDGNVTLQAQNQAGGITDGYTGNFVSLDASELTIKRDLTGLDYDNQVITSGALSPGKVSFNLDLRWDMIEQPATTTQVNLTAITDEVTEFVGSPSPVSLGSTDMRFGRLAMQNVFGSELIDLVMPMRAEYFDGTNFIVNIDDGCTTIDHAAIPTQLLVIPDLSGGSSTVTVIQTTAIGGDLNVQLTKPGAENTGDIRVIPNLIQSGDSWLQYDWNGIDELSDGNLYDDNPMGTATFGIFKGDSRQIYYRQIY